MLEKMIFFALDAVTENLLQYSKIDSSAFGNKVAGYVFERRIELNML